MTYTIEHPLFQSRNAGKVHAQHCGNRSRYGRVLKNTVGLTLEEVNQKYGNKCCQICLPAVVKALPEPVEQEATTPDADELQYEVENLGPHVYVSYAKGDARRTVKRLNTEAEAEAFVAGLKAAAAL